MADKKKKVTTTVTTTTVTETIVPVNEKTHIICILDRSGSMGSIIGASISGFNEFLGKQKALPDKATITVALFDDQYNILYDNIDIKNAEKLTTSTWVPRGMTALYDAIGKTINTERQRLAKLGDEAPSKVLVCVVTDGQENASEEFKGEEGRKQIVKLIRECENLNWNFLYLAANQDAFAVGGGFGMSRGNTVCYTADAKGVAGMSMTLNNATSSYRSMSSSDQHFKKMSKSLIDVQEDEKNVQDFNSGSITTVADNTIKFTVGSPVTTDGTNVVNGTSCSDVNKK